MTVQLRYKIFFLIIFSAVFFTKAQVIKYDDRPRQLEELIKDLKSRYDEVKPMDWLKVELYNTVFLVKLKNKWGACLGGTELITPQYDEMIFAAYPKENQQGNFRFVLRKKDKWGIGYILYAKFENNASKEHRYKEMLPVVYDEVNLNCNYVGYFDSRDESSDVNIKSNNKWGVARVGLKGGNKFENLAYIEIIAPKYDEIKNNFYHGYAKVKIKDKWGIIDVSGKETASVIYDEITDPTSMCENILGVRISKLWGIYDLESKQIISPIIYDYVECTGSPKKSSTVIIHKNGKSGLFNKLSKKESSYPVDAKINADANCFGVEKDGKWYLYNKEGVVINLTGYDKIENFNYRFAKVSSNGKIGLFDKTFLKESISPIYDGIEHYYTKTGIIYGVTKNGKWGIVDTVGKVIVEPVYEQNIWGCLLHEEARDNIIVKLNEKWGIINSNGDMVAPIKYDGIYRSNHYVPEGQTKSNKKSGIINLVTGKEVLPPIYDEIITNMNPNNLREYEFTVNHFFIVKLNGKSLFINHDGKEIPDPHK